MEEKYRHLITEGYEFEFGTYFQEGWRLFAKGAGSFIGYILVAGIIIYVISIVLSLAVAPLLVGSLDLGNSNTPESGVWLSLGGYFFIQNALLTIFQWCMLGGFFVFARNLILKRDDFGQFFAGFNYLGPISRFYLLWLFILIPFLIILFTLLIPGDLVISMINGDLDDLQYLAEDFVETMVARLPAFFILYLILIVLLILYSFTLALIVDSRLSAWTAMETSRRVVGKKFFHFLALYLVAGLMMVVGGTITCFLGLVVLFPYVLCIQFVAYDRIFKPSSGLVEDRISEFGSSAPDANTEADESR